jgi:predicted aspartyl protease
MTKMERNIGTLSKEIALLSKGSTGKSESRENFDGKTFRRRRQLPVEEIECYTCHKKGHYQRNCPENTDSNRETQRSTNKGNSSDPQKAKSNQMTGRLGDCTSESGMFVNVGINDIKTKFLIDTGATVSMLSKGLYDKIKDHSCSEIQETKMNVFTADGTQMKLDGKLDILLKLGTEEFGISALISDIQPDGILGLDIIRNHDMMISAKDQTLTIGNDVIPVMFEGVLGCFRIVAQETFSIPPRSERVVQGKLCTQDGVDIQKEGIVNMPNTKNTATKGRKCSLCPLRFYTDEEMAKHISCSKALIYCDHCDFNSLKSRIIKRHTKRKHDLVEYREQVGGDVASRDQGNGDSAEESWISQGPGNSIEVIPAEVDEHEKDDFDHEPGSLIKGSLREEASTILEIGRVVRKPAKSLSIQIPTRKFGTATLPDKSTSTDILPDMLKRHRDIQCQTDPVIKTMSGFQ